MHKILAETLERITDAFVALDENWCYTYMNKKAAEIFNRNAAEMIGKHIWTEFPDGTNQPFYQAYHKAMDEQKYTYLEEYYAPYDAWFENHIYPSKNGLSVYFRDISERKKNEESLKLFRTLMDKSTDAIEILDPETLRFIDVNETECQQLGYTKEELLSLSIFDINPSMNPATYNANALRTAGNKTHEKIHRRKDGTTFPVEINLKYIQLDREYLIVVVRDITERKTNEKALRESEAKYRTVVENIHESLVVEDIEGKVVYANEEFTNIFGFSHQELSTLAIKDYTTPEFYNEVLDRHNKRILGLPAETEFEYKGLRKDGKEIWIECRVTQIVEDGKIIGTQSLERDITERKKAQENLIESEERYRLFFEHSGQGIHLTEPNGNILSVNAAACEIYERSEEEICRLGRNGLLNLKDPRLPVLLETRKKTGYAKGETTALKRDGTIFPIEITSNLFTNSKGEERTSMLITDLSEIKKTERELVEKENRLRAIIETEPECIKLLDINNNLLEMNKAGLSLIEADSLEQVLGINILTIVDEKYHAAFDKLTKDVFKGKSGTLEFEITGIKGSQKRMETHAVPMRDADGEITALLAITRDITEKKKAEQKIHQSEEKFRKAFHASPDSISISTQHDGKLIEVNEGFTKISGFTREQAIGKTIVELGILPDKKSREQIHANFEASKGIDRIDFIFFNKEREERIGSLSMEKMSWKNEDCLLTVIRDITEFKKSQEEILKMNERLRTLSSHLQNIREEERTNMAREIHDELGQQLTLVKMNLFSLLKNNENVSPAFQEKAKEIGESINKTVDMVRRIATELRPVILDEHGLADAILSHSNEFTKRTGIKTNVDVKGINSIYDLSINTDVFRIYQESLTNIARHANATKVDAVIKTENDFLKLLITDDGNGFNMENRRNKKSLGLLMMQERAISIGGLVKIISEEGEGTSILLTIPIGNN